MSLLQRYILSELLKVFCLAVVALTVLLMFVGVYRQISQSGLGPAQVLQILPFVAPSMLPFTIPAMYLLTVCVVYGRMSGDLEITAAKAAGINVLSLLMPSFGLAAVLSVASFVMMDQAIPWAVRNIERTITQAMEEIFLDVLRTHHQVSDPKHGFSITVMDVKDRTLIMPTFQFSPKKKEPITIQAQEATFTFDLKKKEVMLHLVRGFIDTPGEERAWFEKIEKPFPLPSESQDLKPRNLSVRKIRQTQQEQFAAGQELRLRRDVEAAMTLTLGQFDQLRDSSFLHNQVNIKANDELLHKLHTEVYSRFAMSLSCFCFVLIGAPYAILRGDKQFLMSFFWCFLPLLLVYYPVTMLMQNLGKTGTVNPAWGMWAGNLLTLMLGWRMLRKVLRY